MRTKSDLAVYITTPEEQEKIREGQMQLAKGEYYTNEQVELEIDKWLKEK